MQSTATMLDRRRLSVHQLFGRNDPGTEHLPDRLMSQADTQQRDASGYMFDQRERNAGFVWRAWSRRDNDVRRPGLIHHVQSNRIVTRNAYICAELAQILHEIVCKRIVVVDHEYHAPT